MENTTSLLDSLENLIDDIADFTQEEEAEQTAVLDVAVI